MNNIILMNQSIPQIGYYSRSTTIGEEFDMVTRYINFFIKKNKHLINKKYAIFVEPCIATGYPDIVIIEYFNSKNINWNTHRAKLQRKDLKILFEIQANNYSSIKELKLSLGFSEKEIVKSLSLLEKSQLIHTVTQKGKIRKVKLNTFSGIKKIISIEAKIDKWREALQQASKNICFSTESYILLNKKFCNEHIIESCKKQGVGIILVNGKIETILKSEQRTFPVSYMSFEFNEWLNRYTNITEERHDNI